MPASHRLPQRGLAFLLGLLLALGFPFLPASLPPSSAQDLAAVGSAASLDQQARKAYNLGEGDVAARLWRQAAETARSAGDTFLQASMLNNLALAELMRGQPVEASRSFALLDAPAEPSSERALRTRAQLLRTRGRFHFDRGEHPQALTSWRQATKLYRAMKADEDELACLINESVALQRIGNLFEARTLLEALRDRPELTTYPRLEAAALVSLVDTLLSLGEEEEAQKLDVRLTELVAGDSHSDEHTKQLARRGLSDILASKESTGAASKILSISGSSEGLGFIKDEVIQFGLSLKSRNTMQTKQIWPNLLAKVDALPHNADALDLRLDLARSLNLLLQQQRGGKGDQANRDAAFPLELALQRLLQRSLADANHLDNRRASSWAAGELGKLAESARRFPEAKSLTDQALGDAMALNLLELSSRWSGQLGDILRKQGAIPAALEAYKQSLNDWERLQLDITAFSLAMPISSQDSFAAISTEYIDLLTRESTSTTQDERIANLNEARKAIERLQAAELNDFFRQPCFTPIDITKIKDRNVALVYSYKLRDRLEVIVLFPDKQEDTLHHSVPLDQGVWNQTVNELESILSKPTSSPFAKADEPTLLSHAQQLYTWLLAKHDQDLHNMGIKQLVFVPDAALRNVPMAVLHDGRSFLGQRYAISVAPGMVLTPSTRRPGSRPRVLGAGTSEKPNAEALPVGSNDFVALDNVEKELDEVQRLTGATTLRNKEFTTIKLQRAIEAGDYSVVHLATHGQFSSKSKFTFLVSGQSEPIPVKQLPKLLQPSRRRTGNSLDLLILSACETANSDKDNNKKNLGLAAVASLSGASSTLASLWSVDDEATLYLMTAFYRRWLNTRNEDGKPITKAEALRLAQTDMLKSDYNHPSNWAAFTLIGDWR
jgi:CHAT domain-containing protein